MENFSSKQLEAVLNVHRPQIFPSLWGMGIVMPMNWNVKSSVGRLDKEDSTRVMKPLNAISHIVEVVLKQQSNRTSFFLKS